LKRGKMKLNDRENIFAFYFMNILEIFIQA